MTPRQSWPFFAVATGKCIAADLDMYKLAMSADKSTSTRAS